MRPASNSNASSQSSRGTAASSQRGIDFKLVLLGSSGVGKTSMVNMLIRQEFGCNPATIGALFSLYTHNGVSVGIWDTAGSERYDAISSHYCHGASAALLVYSITDSKTFIALKKYYDKIVDTTSGCILIVVGTMLDLVKDNESKRDVSEREGLSYASSIGAEFFETSSKLYINIQEVFQCAVDRYIATKMSSEPFQIPRNLLVSLRDEEENTSPVDTASKTEKESGCSC